MKQIFISLTASNLAASTKFYENLGFILNPTFSNADASSLALSDTIVLNLISHGFFEKMAQGKTFADPRTTSQVGLGISLDSREAVDAFAATALANGGKNTVAPGSEDGGFMYGVSVEDLDGYVWDAMWLDMAKAPGQQA